MLYHIGVLPAEAFLKTIETLFGAENVESVIVPLIAELPERAAATELKVVIEHHLLHMSHDKNTVYDRYAFE
jgi:hypothetical protein